MTTAAERMKALAKPRATQPQLKQLCPGFYRARNGDRYYGEGEVVEKGITHDGGVYIRVEPAHDRLYNPNGKGAFFDPFTGETMPEALLPDWPTDPYETDGSVLPDTKPGTKVGDEAPGIYHAPNGRRYYGIGRLLKLDSWRVEPIPGKRFVHDRKEKDVPDAERPRVLYTSTAQARQAREASQAEAQAQAQDRRKRGKGNYFGGLRPPILRGTTPRLGTESTGVYLALDGLWYVGVGKVIAVGLNLERFEYVYVEPIPGKSGGDYDFFHPITWEWMAAFQGSPRPGESADPNAKQDAGVPDPRHRLWREFPAIERIPEVGEEYPGRYLPPSAPKYEVYLGVGKVVKAGTTEEGRIFVEVVPIPDKFDAGGIYQFFDPYTGKDMPQEYLPDEKE
ncbi:uncharacterized protein DSM5745_04110 [Aspergillus mulundensis]|uniref:Uncharacterized protein n=1 Tax=Aspergillus mulundensis TaxID=1810919 RepID=A0A3D8SCH1_9EURO|nr:hypothetical protein DSM5745_04110 [Aspergillus mulundensis]RDW83784.1 hypothetical protein DSM5745_04110 [Aspergillus mulundensis]